MAGLATFNWIKRRWSLVQLQPLRPFSLLKLALFPLWCLSFSYLLRIKLLQQPANDPQPLLTWASWNVWCIFFSPFCVPDRRSFVEPLLTLNDKSSALGNPCVVMFCSHRTLPSIQATPHTTGTRSHIPQDTMQTRIRLDQTSSLRTIHRYSPWARGTQACESHVGSGSKSANYP